MDCDIGENTAVSVTLPSERERVAAKQTGEGRSLVTRTEALIPALSRHPSPTLGEGEEIRHSLIS
jgi:hypothetical protein